MPLIVEGSSVYGGQTAYTRDEALDGIAALIQQPRPYIYLSAGVSAPHFREQLRLSAEADSRFSGVSAGEQRGRMGRPYTLRKAAEAPSAGCRKKVSRTSGPSTIVFDSPAPGMRG